MAQRAKAGCFDLVLGHDAHTAVAAARGKASAPFAHGGTWVPRAVWAAPPRRKAPKAIRTRLRRRAASKVQDQLKDVRRAGVASMA